MPTRQVVEIQCRLSRPLSDSKRVETSKGVRKYHVASKIERIYNIGDAEQSIEFITVLLSLLAQAQTDAHPTEIFAEIEVGVHHLGQQLVRAKRVQRPPIASIPVETWRGLVDAVQCRIKEWSFVPPSETLKVKRRSIEPELLRTPWCKGYHDLRLYHRGHVIQRVVLGRKLTLVVGVGFSCRGDRRAFEDGGRFRDRKSFELPVPRPGAEAAAEHA